MTPLHCFGIDFMCVPIYTTVNNWKGSVDMPKARGTKISYAQRIAQKRYEAKTYKTLGCKLPREAAEAFTKMVEQDPAFIVGNNEKGSVNAALTSFIKAYMESNRGV